MAGAAPGTAAGARPAPGPVRLLAWRWRAILSPSTSSDLAWTYEALYSGNFTCFNLSPSPWCYQRASWPLFASPHPSPSPSPAPCSPFPSPLGRDAKWLSCRSAVDTREIPVHPDRNVTCESFRKMVARQREPGGAGEPGTRCWTSRGYFKLQPVPAAPLRRSRVGLRAPTPGAAGAGGSCCMAPPGADPRHPHPHRQPPAQAPPSRLSLPDRKAGSRWGAARGARGAPHGRGRKKGRGSSSSPAAGWGKPWGTRSPWYIPSMPKRGRAFPTTSFACILPAAPCYISGGFCRPIVKNQEWFCVKGLRATFPDILWLCFYKYLRLPRVSAPGSSLPELSLPRRKWE